MTRVVCEACGTEQRVSIFDVDPRCDGCGASGDRLAPAPGSPFA
ncbi:hypothetical protein ACFQJD_18785 [Haloplanus sp. GCM10025708]